MAKGRSTLILFASILVVGAFILVQETWRFKSETRQYHQIRLFDLDPESVFSFSFEVSNLVVSCTNQSGVWMTGDPQAGMGRADVTLVYRTLAGLNSIGKGIVITPEHLQMRGIEPEEYGFCQPATNINVLDNHGTRSWQIGRKTPLGNMLYAKQEGHPEIYTVSDKLLALIPTKSDQFRDRSLFPGSPTEVRRIEIRGSAGLIQILKDPHSGWQVQQPLATPADVKKVDAFLRQAYSFRVEDFVADEVSDFSVYGLQGERQQIALGGVDGSSRMLLLGDPIPNRPGMIYARRADDHSVFALGTNALNLVNVKVDDLRDVRVLPLPSKEISGISISHGSQRLELTRSKEGAWKIIKPVNWKADPQAVEKLLGLWEVAVILEFKPVSDHLPPDWDLVFASESLGKTNHLAFMPSLGKKDGLWMIRDQEPLLYQINLPLIPDSILDPLQYKDRQIWKLDPATVQKISIQKSGMSPEVFERSKDGMFISSNPELNTASIQKLLTELSDLSTPEYVTYNPRDLSVYGLDSPSLEIHITLSDATQLGRVLLVGTSTDGGYYAMVKGRDVVFLLPENRIASIMEDASHTTMDKSVDSPPAEK